ncbi:MAG: NAD(P)/FAD-dependent oxidoreductase [Myxococcales bacterium]|nr:NAD(P)/FAD-dependent oxidoreductase [Myxococcales bacterium]
MAHHVVIVGGGFGGLEAARRLNRPDLQVTLVDRQNYHLFQPLLYQVATAGLSPGDIASPIRNLVATDRNVEVRMGEVTGVDLAAKRVKLADGELSYDSLVLAAGVRHSYFGKGEWEGDAPGLKTLDDALEIRRRVLLAFENAEREDDATKRAAWLTFVVVGGGPTGVELAGAISELARFTIAKDFRRFDPRTAKIVLVEAGARVLAAFDTGLSGKARSSLEKLHVDVRLQTRVLNVTSEGVQLPDGFLPARTVLWAAGVEAPPLSKTLGVELDRSGRIKVQADLSLPGHPDVYAIGDLACFTLPDGTTLPGLAPVALQQGKHVARNIEAALAGKPRQPFDYVDKGIMATVGRASGIAQAGALKLSGMLGWLAWLFIHILFLIGFRNRLLVMFQWAWAWFTYGRGARLITGTTPVPESRSAQPTTVEAPRAKV